MRPVCEPDSLTTFMCPIVFQIWKPSPSWNPQGLPKPVMSLVYRREKYSLGFVVDSVALSISPSSSVLFPRNPHYTPNLTPCYL
jgi:hypothetical protein